MQILQVENLTKNFGGLAAVSGVDFQVESGEDVYKRQGVDQMVSFINVLINGLLLGGIYACHPVLHA